MKKKIKIGFLDFWEGFSLSAFVDRHPYLLKKYELIESDHPDFRFISVFGRRAGEFFVPDDNCINMRRQVPRQEYLSKLSDSDKTVA